MRANFEATSDTNGKPSIAVDAASTSSIGAAGVFPTPARKSPRISRLFVHRLPRGKNQRKPGGNRCDFDLALQRPTISRTITPAISCVIDSLRAVTLLPRQVPESNDCNSSISQAIKSTESLNCAFLDLASQLQHAANSGCIVIGSRGSNHAIIMGTDDPHAIWILNSPPFSDDILPGSKGTFHVLKLHLQIVRSKCFVNVPGNRGVMCR